MATATQVMTESELREAVRDELRWEPSVDDREIGVSVKDGVVKLTGTVRNFFEKWEAGSAARRIQGVQALANDIEVVLPGDVCRTDSDIARSAAQALAWDVSIPANRVQVTVSDGWVTLNGELDWGYQKAAAGIAVRRLIGVRGVTLDLSIKPKMGTGDIHDQIRAALRRSSAIDAQRIVIEIEDGDVTLRGDVCNWLEREEAERAAWGTHGVTSVDNLILVEPGRC